MLLQSLKARTCKPFKVRIVTHLILQIRRIFQRLHHNASVLSSYVTAVLPEVQRRVSQPLPEAQQLRGHAKGNAQVVQRLGRALLQPCEQGWQRGQRLWCHGLCVQLVRSILAITTGSVPFGSVVAETAGPFITALTFPLLAVSGGSAGGCSAVRLVGGIISIAAAGIRVNVTCSRLTSARWYCRA